MGPRIGTLVCSNMFNEKTEYKLTSHWTPALYIFKFQIPFF